MMNQDIIHIVKPILQDADVTRAAIFGSFARGEQTNNSDLDLLVEFGKPTSLFGFLHLKSELEDQLHKKVDLVTYKALRPMIRDTILKDQKVIYGKKF